MFVCMRGTRMMTVWVVMFIVVLLGAVRNHMRGLVLMMWNVVVARGSFCSGVRCSCSVLLVYFVRVSVMFGKLMLIIWG